MKKFAFALLAAIAAAGPLPAQAQKPVYKYVYPDGRIVYSDDVVPGARLEGQVEAPPPPNLTGTPAAAPRPPAAAPDAEKAPEGSAKTLDEAWEKLKLAKRRLDEARAKLESGTEPQEGERTGTAKGGSRLNDAYWARQKANEEAVRKAEERVRQAQSDVNRLR